MSIIRTIKGNVRSAATLARDGVDDLRLQHDLGEAYRDFGLRTIELMNAGKLAAPELDFDADRIRALRDQLEAAPKHAASRPLTH